MPHLSDSMEEGTILKWLKPAGTEVEQRRGARRDRNRQGDDDLRGRRRRRARDRRRRGRHAPDRRRVIARIGDGQRGPGRSNGRAGRPRPAALWAAPARRRRTRRRKARARPAAAEAAWAPRQRPRKLRACGRRHAPTASGSRHRRWRAAWPREQGIDLASAPRHRHRRTGRTVRGVSADVKRRPPAAEPTATFAASLRRPPPRGVERGRVRQGHGHRSSRSCRACRPSIARRMAESKATIPEFGMTTEIEMEACVDFRSQLKECRRRRQPLPPTTTWSSKPARWRCATSLAPMAPTSTAVRALRPRQRRLRCRGAGRPSRTDCLRRRPPVAWRDRPRHPRPRGSGPRREITPPELQRERSPSPTWACSASRASPR